MAGVKISKTRSLVLLSLLSDGGLVFSASDHDGN